MQNKEENQWLRRGEGHVNDGYRIGINFMNILYECLIDGWYDEYWLDNYSLVSNID